MGRFVVLLVSMGAIATALAPAAAAQTVVLRPPVDAPIIDPFRAPETTYGQGNRGIEYDTTAGVGVDAAGPGLVVFAGPVAGRAWVTILHQGGLRTSYGPLSLVAVATGDPVEVGDRIGSTAGPLHFSTRVDGD
ncbi:MAG: peptidoglycan DD-metalloendopeptidase family protein, partial [Acidimicrobiales bacterium]